MEEVLKNLTSEQQQKFNQISAELKYLTDTQWKAIYGLCPMTQELFNGIQLERLKIGDELESAALEVFLKYPEFALSYSDCLEKAIETLQSDSGTPENSAIISEDVYEKIQCVVKESFPYSFN